MNAVWVTVESKVQDVLRLLVKNDIKGEQIARMESELLLNLDFTLFKHQRFAYDTLPHTLNFLHDGLEMRRRIVRACDEDII